MVMVEGQVLVPLVISLLVAIFGVVQIQERRKGKASIIRTMLLIVQQEHRKLHQFGAQHIELDPSQ